MIRLENISVHFLGPMGKIQAVSNVNLHIRAGEIFGVIGYSGAGKSTLVRTINMLQRPSTGQVFVGDLQMDNLDTKALRKARKKIGMIFQHFNLMNARDVADNIRFAMMDSPLSSKEKEDRIDELLALVGLSDRKHAYPRQLSGGQKQRVAIARALANDPDVLLCDEATSALDPKTTEAILNLLKELNQKLNLTIVIITHEMRVIKTICDRVAVMEAGSVIEEGRIYDIFTQPKQDLTKRFIESASDVEKGIKHLLENGQRLGVLADDRLIRLDFNAQNTSEPIIAVMAQKYHIQPSILYGNVEMLQGQPAGTLLVKLRGEEDQIQSAIAYLNATNVQWQEYYLKGVE